MREIAAHGTISTALAARELEKCVADFLAKRLVRQKAPAETGASLSARLFVMPLSC